MEIPPNQSKLPVPGIKPILIEDELKSSFLDYAMSVVVSRALPDVRDGLKPVHRRILYAMHTQGYHYNRPYHKSVRVVGEVLGKYHPHGDQAVYNTMVGMVQDFSKRYPLLDGQGNWGSVDGDNAAAMRYTEVRMKKISDELLADLDKETVPFVPNFDESTVEPVILPSKLPHLLMNGASGIAVGMATTIPPHNLTEVIDGCLAMIRNRDMTDEQLFSIIQAPDFPTGGIICGRAGIIKAYLTGRGSFTVRGIVEIEETKKGTAIVVAELPYQVNKAELTIKIAELVKEKVIEGITNIRDESNKKGIRLVIDVKKSEDPQLILNQLYKYTDLETNIHMLMLSLLDNRPMIFTLREMLQEFLAHREEVIYKRSVYDLKRAQSREHILQGLLIALGSIDDVVQLIKKSQTAQEAIEKLHAKFTLSEEQAKAILEMRLQRLTGLEQEKINNEISELIASIADLNTIIQDRPRLHQEIIKELEKTKEEFGDKRKTQIGGEAGILSAADLIPDEEVVVTLTRKGYIKRVPVTVYQLQHRGGKGKMGISDLEEVDDLIENVFVARNHDELLFFTSLGRVYSMNVYEVPEASRTARGRAIVNLLTLGQGEKVVKLLCLRGMENKFIVMVTKNGTIKRVDAMRFANIRTSGIRAITLDQGDDLAYCAVSNGNDDVMIATAKGQGIHFKEAEVRVMGREAAGVIGIRCRKGDHVIGMEIVSAPTDILFATANGYGKRVSSTNFRQTHRSGVGVRTIPTTKRNGDVIGLVKVSDSSNVLLIDSLGKIIRLPSQEIRTMGRGASGVRLIKLDDGQHLVGMVAFEENHNNGGLPEEDTGGSDIVGAPEQKVDGPIDQQQSTLFMFGDLPE